MNTTKINQVIWNDFYKFSKRFLYWPSEDLVAFFNNYFDNDLRKRKVLDVGCGVGRNLLLCGSLGAEIYGVDSSIEAIKESKDFLQTKDLNPYLSLGESTNLPYADNFFDIAIAWGIFHYLDNKDQEKTKKEIKRVLKGDGLFLFTLRSIHDSRYGKGEEVDQNMFKQDKPGKKGIIIQYWDEDEARSFFNLDNMLIGEGIRSPIGNLEKKSAHWMIAGRIKK